LHVMVHNFWPCRVDNHNSILHHDAFPSDVSVWHSSDGGAVSETDSSIQQNVNCTFCQISLCCSPAERSSTIESIDTDVACRQSVWHHLWLRTTRNHGNVCQGTIERVIFGTNEPANSYFCSCQVFN